MIDLENKVFLDTDGEMTFENKERLNFIMHFLKKGADKSVVETKNGTFVREDAETSFNEIWLPCAEAKRQEIDDLKAQLKALHDSRIEFVEYCRKVESGDFVLVPVEPTPKMIDSTWDDQDEIDTMSHNTRNEFIYKKMIEVAMAESARGGNE